MTMITVGGLQMATAEPCISPCHRMSMPYATLDVKGTTYLKLASSSYISSRKHLCQSLTSASLKFTSVVPKAMSSESGKQGVSGMPSVSRLPIDLRGKRAFIAGVADDNGYGWAIAKALAAAAGADILVGTWVPTLNIFETSLRRGKFDESRQLANGSLMEIIKVYPLDAVFDTPEDVPEDIKTNKCYSGSSNWTVKEVAECVKND